MSTKIIQNEQIVLRSFGKNLKEAREAQGLSISEVSVKLGIERTSYYKYENGSRFPKPEMIYAIMDTLKVDANTLFFADAGKPNEEPQHNPELRALIRDLEVPAVYHYLMYHYLLFIATPENKKAIADYREAGKVMEGR